MDLFKDLIKYDQNGNISFNTWIEWTHFLIPNKPLWLRQILRNIISLLGHCMLCSALDGCYFAENNTPKYPLHLRCDCEKKTLLIQMLKTMQHQNAI